MSLTPYTSDFAEKTANCTGEYKKKKEKKADFIKKIMLQIYRIEQKFLMVCNKELLVIKTVLKNIFKK